MTWADPKGDLRVELSDLEVDRPRNRKAVFGKVNGANLIFKTLEPKRVTNLATTTDVRLGVFVDGAKVTVSSDDPVMGEFTLAVAPAEGKPIVASYYCQWFADTDLDRFLRLGTSFVGMANDVANVPEGLQAAVLKFAAGEAYQKLALYWAEFLSTQFKAEDAPKADTKTPQDIYRQMSKDLKADAKQIRDDYYKRQGRPLSPRFASIRGRVRNVVR